ncbi:MAG: hypothetical protein RLZZ127_1762 [Planctomycetota bacterium]|jgi:hypothetical protein
MLVLWWWRMRREWAAELRRLAGRPGTAAAMAAGVAGVLALITGLTLTLLWFLQQPTWMVVQARLLQVLLAVFLLGLGVLVVGSHALLCWGHLFRGPAAQRHAAAPISERVRWWGAVVEAAGLCTATALVLAGPLIACLAWVAAVPALFLLAGAVTMALFLACGCAAGGCLALVLARVVPWVRKRGPWLAIAIAVGLIACAAPLLARPQASPGDVGWVREVVGRLAFAEQAWLPSRWAGEALSAALAARWGDWAWHALVLAATAAALGVLGETMAHRRLARAWDALHGLGDGGRARPRTRPWPAWAVEARALLAVKHLRTARRDPLQLLQIGLFALLLAGYLLLLPRFGGLILADDRFRPFISVLNQLAISMALSVHAARFVFPAPGVEGRRLWLLAMAPITAAAQWWAIVLAAWAVSLPVAVILFGLSARTLGLDPALAAMHALSLLAIALGLGAGAAALGARLADPNKDDAGRIAAGPGGTIHLAVALGWVVLNLGLAVVPAFLPPGLWWLASGAATVVLTAAWIALAARTGTAALARLPERLVR